MNDVNDTNDAFKLPFGMSPKEYLIEKMLSGEYIDEDWQDPAWFLEDA